MVKPYSNNVYNVYTALFQRRSTMIHTASRILIYSWSRFQLKITPIIQ